MPPAKRTCFALLLILIFWAGVASAKDNPVEEDALPKTHNDLQDETIKYLGELDQLKLNAAQYNTLYSDQSSKNICRHLAFYERAAKLEKDLSLNLKEWKKFVNRNYNDKVYRLFEATVELALYCIYTRPYEFLNVLKFDQEIRESNCSPKAPLPSWSDKIDEWERKGESMLLSAQESVTKAFKIDPYYPDTRIMQAQILALQGEYAQAKQALAKIEAEGWFKEQRSYLSTWKAFIETGINNRMDVIHPLTEDKLKEAAAFSEPFESSQWAADYLKNIRKYKEIFLDIKADDIQAPTGNELEKVKSDTEVELAKLNQLLLMPLDNAQGIPAPLPEEMDVKELKEQRIWVMEGLGKYNADDDLNRFALLIEDLHASGKSIADLRDKWNRMARSNNQASYFFLVNKTALSLGMLKAISLTKPLVTNEDLLETLADRQKKRNPTKTINYLQDWEDWEESINSELSGDVQKIVNAKPESLPAKMINFEYSALVLDPTRARAKLEEIKPLLSKRELNVFSQNRPIDGRLYLAAWESYLALMENQIPVSEDYLESSQSYNGLEKWKEKQEKIMYLKRELPETGKSPKK